MLEELEREPKRDIKIWIDQGTREWSTFTRNTVNILLQKGYKYCEELAYYEVKGAPHSEVAWAARIDNPFILFNGKPAARCVDMRLDVQFIRMFDVGPAEVVVNPVGIFDNGTWYSLYTAAEYSISAPDLLILPPQTLGETPAIGKGTALPMAKSDPENLRGASATDSGFPCVAAQDRPRNDARTGAPLPKDPEAPHELEVTASIDCTGVLQFNKDRVATVTVKYGDLVRKITVQNPNPPPEPPKPPEPEPKSAEAEKAPMPKPARRKSIT